jgi:hypothetical protein
MHSRRQNIQPQKHACLEYGTKILGTLGELASMGWKRKIGYID